MFLQYVWRIVIIPQQVKPESPESWIPSRLSLQPYVQWFDKFVTYYMFDHNLIVDTCDIRRQLGRYIMAPKRKRGEKLKTKGCVEDCYHRMFNNMLESLLYSQGLFCADSYRLQLQTKECNWTRR